VIEVEGLTQRYGRYTAVREVSFALSPGEVVGFLGPNGAGKTTTLKVLAAYLAPSEGRVVVAGHDVRTAPLAVRRALGYLPEHTPLYEEMRVEAFLEFAARIRGIERDDRGPAIARVAERCRLGDVLGRPVAELSKGYRQRVGIAQALLHEPPVLILDEPTHGLDPNQVLEVRELVREVGAERTVLFSSHILSEVEATCRRVLVIHQGRLVADDAVDALAARATGGAVRVRFTGPRGDLAARLDGLDGVAGVAAAGGEDEAAFVVRPQAGVEDLPVRLSRFARELPGGGGAEGADGDDDAPTRDLVELAPLSATLEDVFTALTGAGRG